MKPIKLNFPPNYVLSYAKKISEDAHKDPDVPEAQSRMMEDIVQLVEVAVGVLKPAPKENNS